MLSLQLKLEFRISGRLQLLSDPLCLRGILTEGFVHSEVLRLRVSVIRIILPESSCGVRSRFLSPSGCGTTAGPCAGRLRNGSKNDRAVISSPNAGASYLLPGSSVTQAFRGGAGGKDRQAGDSIVPELSQPLCQPDFYCDITTVFVGVFSARVGSFWSFVRICIALCRTVRTNESFRSERLRRIFCQGPYSILATPQIDRGKLPSNRFGVYRSRQPDKCRGGKRNLPFPPCI